MSRILLSVLEEAPFEYDLPGGVPCAGDLILLDGDKAKQVGCKYVEVKQVARKGVRSKELTCPNCGKVGRGSAMYQWHFDRCVGLRSKEKKLTHGNTGKKASNETRQKQSESGKKRIREPLHPLQCPHCGKVGKGLSMYRFHFDRCKKYAENSE